MSQYPQRIGEPDCRDFLRTGRCKYGDSCKYHHPIGGIKAPLDPNEPPFPIRPDEPPCQYYLKNGTCKFGQTCKFHHPPHIMSRSRSSSLGGSMVVTSPSLTSTVCPVVPVTALDNDMNGHVPTTHHAADIGLLLPQRPSEPHCIYFLKHGRCKYGSTCKYHHPANVHVNVNVMTESHTNSSSRFASNNLNVGVGQIQSHTVSMPPLSRLPQVQLGDRERSLSHGSLQATNDARGDVVHQGAGTNNASNTNGTGPGAAISASSIIRVPSGNSYQAAAAAALQLEPQHPHIYRRVVDSVPQQPTQLSSSQSSRHEVLDTISNSFHLYPLSSSHAQTHHNQPLHSQSHAPIDVPTQQTSTTSQLLHSHSRFYSQSLNTGTGNGTLTPGSGTNGSAGSLATSPKITSPSPTSSTLASSYDTTISGIEKLPPALLQSQNGGIPRNNSGSISINPSRKNSLEDGYDVISTTGSMSGSDPINASSHGTARISNIHHYMQSVQVTTSNNASSIGNRFSSSSQGHGHGHGHGHTPYPLEGGDPRFSSELSSMHSSSSLNQLSVSTSTHMSSASDQNLGQRPPIGIGGINGRRKSTGANASNNAHANAVNTNRNVDDGLSMMTSALLTMLDTPREETQGEGGGAGVSGSEFDFEPRGPTAAAAAGQVPENSSHSHNTINHNQNPNIIGRGEAPSYHGSVQEMSVRTGARTGAGLLHQDLGRGPVPAPGPMPTLTSINLPDLGSSHRGGIQPKPSVGLSLGHPHQYRQHSQSQQLSSSAPSQFDRNYSFNMNNFSDGNFANLNYPTTNRDHEANTNTNGSVNMGMGMSMAMGLGNSNTATQHQQQHQHQAQNYQNLNLSGHSLGLPHVNLNGYDHGLGGTGGGGGRVHPHPKSGTDVPLSPSNPIVQNGAHESAQFWGMSANPTSDTATTSTQFYLSP